MVVDGGGRGRWRTTAADDSGSGGRQLRRQGAASLADGGSQQGRRLSESIASPAFLGTFLGYLAREEGVLRGRLEIKEHVS